MGLSIAPNGFPDEYTQPSNHLLPLIFYLSLLGERVSRPSLECKIAFAFEIHSALPAIAELTGEIALPTSAHLTMPKPRSLSGIPLTSGSKRSPDYRQNVSKS
jgi:hypothetical protein